MIPFHAPELAEKAITIFHNGVILTMDKRSNIANAMGILEDKVLAIGTKESVISEANTFIRSSKEKLILNMVNLAGSCIVPGFIDVHMHPGLYVYFKTQLNLAKIKSYATLRTLLQKEDQSSEPERWILGTDLMEDVFDRREEQRFPTRYDLDSFVPSRPVVIFRHDGHMCSVNSAVLRLIGIDKTNAREKTPESGEIQLDADGNPTGIFAEEAIDYVMKLIPIPSIDALKGASKELSKELAKLGITTCGGIIQAGESGPAGKAGTMELPLMQALIKEGLIEQDFVFYIITDKPKTLPRLQKSFLNLGKDKDRFVIGGIKIFADGTYGSSTAHLFEPFSDSKNGNCGLMVIKREDLFRLAKETSDLGFQVICHSIGDKSNRIVVEVFGEVLSEIREKKPLFRIEHASQLTPEIIKDAATLGIVMACQPAFINSEYTWLEKRLGRKRIKYTYPFRSILDAGILLAGASDAPIESADVLLGLRACVTRNGFVPEQAINIEEALKMFTCNAAYALKQEDLKGSLEKRKLADFVILEKDIRAVPAENIAEIRILATYHRGKRIYSSEIVS